MPGQSASRSNAAPATWTPWRAAKRPISSVSGPGIATQTASQSAAVLVWLKPWNQASGNRTIRAPSQATALSAMSSPRSMLRRITRALSAGSSMTSIAAWTQAIWKLSAMVR